MKMKKIDILIAISELIAREINGQLNQQEKLSLEKWINSSERNQKLYLKITDSDNLATRNSLYESVDIDRAWNSVLNDLVSQRRNRIMSQLIRYAAAILIPLLLGITSYLYLNDKLLKNSITATEIVPGSSTAILVMADGKNVNLVKSAKQNLVENDGTIIKNANSELSYAGQHSLNSKKTLLNTLVVPQGGEYTLILSDGTRVFVNSKSKLVFPVSFKGNKREIALEGEAYFEVTKDKSKPFIVTINGLQVEVLGTSFNIKAYPDDIQSFTTLVEGKVKINAEFRSSHNSFLEPNQQAVYDPLKKEIAIQTVDAKKVVQWISGKYFFTNQPLDEIIKTLSRWYDFTYKFEDESLRNVRFEGGLNKYEKIDPILDIINKTGKVKVSVKGKEVLFSKI